MSKKTESNYFAELVQIECETEKKGNLTYVPWAEAWKQLKLRYPDAQFRILLTEDGNFLHGEGLVMTEVTVGDVTHPMWLPVMDHRNNAVKNPDTMQINKTIMRCLTKNIALHGIGLYPYMGEDVPNDDAPAKKSDATAKKPSGLSKMDRNRINKAGAAAVERDKDVNNDKVKAIYEKYGLVPGKTPAADLDVNKVIAELEAL